MSTDQALVSEVVRRGKAVYQEKLRATLDTPENFRKSVAIDPDSEDYEIDADLLTAVACLRERHPDKLSYTVRIGASAHLRGGRVVKK